MNGCPSTDNGDGLGVGASNACPGDWPVIKLTQGVQRVVDITIVDRTGTAISLDLDVDPDPSTTPFLGDAQPPVDAKVVFTDASGIASARVWMKQSLQDSMIVEVTGYYLGDGKFRFSFSGAAVQFSGLFVADIHLVDGDGKVRYAKPLYIEVEPTTLLDNNSGGPITIAEVRLSLRDCSEANALLEDFEFSDREIMFSIRKVVDHWNEVPPPGFTYTYAAFPFRKHWLDGTVALLLINISHYYRRNKLRYQAGGGSINPMDKSEEYFAVGTRLWEEFKEWVQAKKVSMNVESGWGRVQGGWSY